VRFQQINHKWTLCPIIVVDNAMEDCPGPNEAACTKVQVQHRWKLPRDAGAEQLSETINVVVALYQQSMKSSIELSMKLHGWWPMSGARQRKSVCLCKWWAWFLRPCKIELKARVFCLSTQETVEEK